MNKEDWESLVSSPGWPKLKQYLRDHRAQIAEGLAQGKFSGEKLQEAIIRCQNYDDLSRISFADIEKFYGTETTENHNEP
jgi:hypothetical protein